MKRAFCFMLAIMILLTACAKTDSDSIKEVNRVHMGNYYSSYLMISEEQAIIDDLLKQLNSLNFKKTKDKIHVLDCLNIGFFNEENRVKGFSVDKYGIFTINNSEQCYRISKGEFDYEHLKAIYEDSKCSKTKAELLDIISQMTKPTQQNPQLALSSNPYDYIDAYKDVYDELVEGGQYTLTIFVDVLRNSTEFGLDKYIMVAVCAEITGIGDDDKAWSTAEEWLKLYDEK